MEKEDGQPVSRRLVGIDLGIASRHSVRVLEADGRVVCRSSCVPTVESLTRWNSGAGRGTGRHPAGGGVRVRPGLVMPIAVFFARRGHAVYLVSLAKAADLRRFLRRHAKSNGIDAETLARMPLADPAGPAATPAAWPASGRAGPPGPGL